MHCVRVFFTILSTVMMLCKLKKNKKTVTPNQKKWVDVAALVKRLNDY